MTNFEWLKSLPIKLFADQLIDQRADGTYFSSVCGDLELDGYNLRRKTHRLACGYVKHPMRLQLTNLSSISMKSIRKQAISGLANTTTIIIETGEIDQ